MRWLLFTLLLAVIGCVPQSNPPYIALTRYDCVSTALTVRWAAAFADVDIGGNTYRLARARSGSGARYADGARKIWEHQGELSWTGQGAARVVCRKTG
ncbi:MAG: MliC family protein [Rhodospirillales bacterium]